MDPHLLLFLLLSTSSLSGFLPSPLPKFPFSRGPSNLLFIFAGIEPAATFKLTNLCRQTIWPGLLSGANTAQLPTTGFALRPGKSRTIPIPAGWSGRIWGRTLCSTGADGKFTCLTADCGSGKIECGGSGAKPPATLVEFTLNGADGLDFYDVSLVDGYNLPMLAFPQKVTRGGCGATGCLIDLNGACPKELKYACTRSYSYAYDDKTSTYTCANTDYTIVFCPRPYTR
ncbi:unnamed protein product [Linum tenue]|uniref:Thaumatin-like protein 1 n=1 Tax=Linum tenue TaxID=586396 RepID=A0AAV0M0A3_9ROSI|nr:unnamed protein product [Linum tenue]